MAGSYAIEARSSEGGEVVVGSCVQVEPLKVHVVDVATPGPSPPKRITRLRLES